MDYSLSLSPMRWRWRVGFIVAVLCAGALLIPIRSANEAMYGGYDDTLYWIMASGHATNAPHTWRILYPAIVRAVPLPLATAFPLTMYVVLGIDLALVFVLLDSYGYTERQAWIGVVLALALPYFVPHLLYNVYLVDGLAMAFVLTGMIAAKRRNGPLFFAALTFGVLAKESVLFVAPLWVTLAYKPTWRVVRQAALFTLPAVCILVLLRVAMPDPHYNLVALPAGVAQIRLERGFQLGEYVPFGVLPVLALLAPGWRGLLLRYAPFVALVYAQLIFASDTGRLLVMAFPALLVAAVGAVGGDTVS